MADALPTALLQYAPACIKDSKTAGKLASFFLLRRIWALTFTLVGYRKHEHRRVPSG